MQRLGQQRLRFDKRPGRQVFQEQRKVVRQLLGLDVKAAGLVQRHEVDHRLAAVPAFAVDMLEQVQGQRARAVEQLNVAFLQVDQVAVCDLVDQRVEAAPHPRRQQRLLVEHDLELGRRALDRFRRVG